MQVSTTSWHYRFLRAMKCRRPSNLCSYFWMVVLHMALVVFFVVMALAVSALILSPILALWIEWFEQVVIAGYVLWIGILVLTWLCYRHKQKYDRLRLGYEAPPDGLSTAWIKAKKAKVCPLIEYTA